MTSAIVARDIAKRYDLTGVDAKETLRERLVSVARHPIARARNRSGAVDVLWALRDISFDIADGEAVGIIGHNGAGKSTLLRVLSRITEPTSGWAEVRGRVGSLLEVGTGFHPELTGRENVYLNGSILGMPRREIARKFDEIVAFAGVERFLETPVKRYSTGMRTRLAFSVAAHVEPEILLVDEVLAVGDADFQRRCLTRMDEISRDGRTVLFVSHNMSAIRSLCTRGMVLHAGRMHFDGPVGKAVEEYYELIRTVDEDTVPVGLGLPSVEGQATIEDTTVTNDEPFTVRTTLTVPADTAGFTVFCTIHDMDGTTIAHLKRPSTELGVAAHASGTYDTAVTFPALWLTPGPYTLRFKVEFWGTTATANRGQSPAIVLDVTGASPAVRSTLHPSGEWVLERRD